MSFAAGQTYSCAVLQIGFLDNDRDTGDNQYLLTAEVEPLPPDSPPVTLDPDTAKLIVYDDDIGKKWMILLCSQSCILNISNVHKLTSF